MPLQSGTKVGRFTIHRLVAQGGMAEVYLADQELTPGITRPAAVKVIRPEYSESDDFREMFLDEARTACTLSHPNIAHIYEVGETDDGLLYMAMEFVPGETLATINRTLRDASERFSDEAIFAIGIGTCAALEAVHALKTEGGTVNLVHRDVSPHNLLLSPTGALKLIDFGIAKAATNRNLTMPGVTKGKAGYFSPEQAMGKKLDGRSDLFSLGVTLYKLASGNTPFDDYKNHAERHAALVRGQWERLDVVYPGMAPGFYAAIDRALQLKPEARFQTARDMREALEKAAFEAGIRVSQSNLIGYVDHDGEVTATGGSRSSASIPIAAPPTVSQVAPKLARAAVPQLPMAPPRESNTEKLPAQKRSPVLPLAAVAVAFVAAIALGIFGMLAAFGPEAPPQPAPVVEVAPPVEPPRPGVVKLPDVDVDIVPDALPAPEKPEGVQPVKVAAATVKPKKDPVKKPPALPREPVEKVATPVKEPVAEEIPQGQGKLRIGASPADAVAGILVGRDDWGMPPVDKKVSSGHYTVVMKLADGKKSLAWKGAVYPDRTTVLVYDASNGRWSAK